ncbi:hypothetical protein [Lysinibacillus capsici]|uniref:hypothetical protein n=1 Tax=Lysinibacillus capsici TaxID=2115968 RepID=UPI0034E426B1
MGLYSDTRTVSATRAQLKEMKEAQQKARNLVKQSGLTESVVKNTYASYGGAVLGLVFVASTVASVAAGFISLLTSLNAAEKSQVQSDIDNGYIEILETYTFILETSYVSCNMTLKVNKERPGAYGFAFIKSRVVNSFTTPGGQIALPN